MAIPRRPAGRDRHDGDGDAAHNKLRSALTILGVVIGVTSIVGMTSLVRGFGDQLESLVRQLGSDTVFVVEDEHRELLVGQELPRHPEAAEPHRGGRARHQGGRPSAGIVAMNIGDGPGAQFHRLTYGNNATKTMIVVGATANFAEVNFIPMDAGRGFSDFESDRRRQVVMLGNAPATTLFPASDPARQEGAHRRPRIHGDRRLRQAPRPLGGNPDEFVVIPLTTTTSCSRRRFRGYLLRMIQMIAILPREGSRSRTSSRTSSRSCAAGTG